MASSEGSTTMRVFVRMRVPRVVVSLSAASILITAACGPCLAAARPFLLEVEAESASVVKPPLIVREGRGASGGKVLYADPLAYGRPDRVLTYVAKPNRAGRKVDGFGLAQYEIEAPKEGAYCAWFRVWFPDMKGDSFYYRVNDGAWTRLSQNKRFEWRRVRARDLTLKAGANRVQLAAREADVVIDKLVICSDTRYVPRTERERWGPVEKFTYTMPDKPGKPDAAVTYLNHFDDDSGRAVSAKGDPRIGGMHCKLGSEGRFGKGILISHPKAYLLIMGEDNANTDALTLDFWFRSEDGKDIFSDGKTHYLVSVLFHPWLYMKQGPIHQHRRGGKRKDEIRIVLKGDKIGLTLYNGPRVAKERFFTIPTNGAKGDQWRHFLFSWDKKTKRFWLGLDGKGRTRVMRTGWNFQDVLCLHVGAAIYYKTFTPLGGALDELRIRNVAASDLTRRRKDAQAGKPDAAPRPQAPAAATLAPASDRPGASPRKRIEDSCRKFLDFYAGLQRNGGWGTLQHHPTLWDFGRGERHTIRSYRNVDFAKGGQVGRKIMGLYLPAYEVFGDRKYLEVARRSCDVLLKGQGPNGVLKAHYFVFPDGRIEPVDDADLITMPGDEGPANAILMLVWFGRLSGERKYIRAAARCAELYIKAQNPNGSWAQTYNLKIGRVHSSGSGYGVLNDGTTTEPMRILLLMYHVTKDTRFLAPIVKAGDWLVRVQNKQGGIPGWAEQYDEHDQPCWARYFEPPAVCALNTSRAMRALLMVHKLTHDEKYLEPLRKLARWLREHPAETRGRYTDPKTGESIHGAGHRIRKGGTAQGLRSGNWVKERKYPAFQPDYVERLIKEAIQSAQNPFAPPPLEEQKANWRRTFRLRARGAARWAAGQNERGYWVGQSTWKNRAMQCASTVTYKNVPRMLNHLHVLAAAEGRVPPCNVASVDYRLRAWPVADLYDTPLKKKRR